MTAQLSPMPKFRAFDANGDPLSGGKVYTYEAGTTTPKNSYTSSTGLVANANPVILDASGYADIWLDGTYKIVLKDSSDVTIYTVDNIATEALNVSAFMQTVLDDADAATARATLGITLPPFSDGSSLIKGSSDTTKQIRFEVDGLTTETTRVLTVPDADLTIVGTTATQTLTNKSLSDSTTSFIDEADATKIAKLQCSGITAGQTRTLTVPDASGTIKLTGTANTRASTTPADPTGTTSATQVMMGLAASFTPTGSGIAEIIITGSSYNGSGGTINTHQIRYGTGTAPANGVAATGTTIGPAVQIAPANGGSPTGLALSGQVTGLTPNTAYWFDIGLATASNTASIKQLCVNIKEL